MRTVNLAKNTLLVVFLILSLVSNPVNASSGSYDIAQIETVEADIEETERIEVTDIVISDYDEILEVDSTITLSATVLPSTATDQTLHYSSSNTAIATVSPTGEIKGLAPGKVVISVSSGKVEKKIAITVKISAKCIEVGESLILLKPNETYQLHATVLPENASNKDLKYVADNSDVATVSGSGLITAQSCGNTMIIIKNEDAMTAVSVVVNGSVDTENKSPEDIHDSGEFEIEDVLHISECPIVNSDMLRYLYDNRKNLLIEAENYSITICGDQINNLNNSLHTNLDLKKSKNSISFTINNNEDLCGKILVCIDNASEYRYLYLYNDTTEKYDLINNENLGVIELTTSGEYLLTNTPVSDSQFWWLGFGILGLIIIILLIVYFCIKKKYWFW